MAQPYVLKGGQPTPLVAAEMRRCYRGEPGLFERLEEQGYEMIEARLESPRGYRRDARGRLVQTSFDLRRRGYLGFADRMHFDLDGSDGVPSPTHSLTLEVGGINDKFYRSERRRRRTRFLEGRFVMSPVELDAQLLRTDSVRASDEPGLWIALPFGDLRLDIPLQLGVGAILGRLHYRQIDGGRLMLLDLLGIHTTWEFYQGALLEDYALVRLGVGTGLRRLSAIDRTPLYFYPEAGIEMAWTLGARGLTQIAVDTRAQLAAELGTGERWVVGAGSLSLEQILFIVTDNPISLFVQPEVRYDRLDFAQLNEFDYRLFVGARISGFSSPRQPPEDNRIPITPAHERGGQR